MYRDLFIPQPDRSPDAADAAGRRRYAGDGRARLGGPYTVITATGVLLSIIVGLRAQRRLGRPEARAFVAEHWRFGQLYSNAADPALFVPTRTGSRWTLNFGRPVAVVLLGLV